MQESLNHWYETSHALAEVFADGLRVKSCYSADATAACSSSVWVRHACAKGSVFICAL